MLVFKLFCDNSVVYSFAVHVFCTFVSKFVLIYVHLCFEQTKFRLAPPNEKSAIFQSF